MLSTRYLLCVEGRKVPDGDAVQWSWPNLLADGFIFNWTITVGEG